MNSILILIIILLGSLLLKNFLNKVIEPLATSCSEIGKTDVKINIMESSVDNFKSDTDNKIKSLEANIKLLNPLISANSSSASNNSKELKKLSKKIEDGMKGKGDEMDKIDLG